MKTQHAQLEFELLEALRYVSNRLRTLQGFMLDPQGYTVGIHDLFEIEQVAISAISKATGESEVGE